MSIGGGRGGGEPGALAMKEPSASWAYLARSRSPEVVSYASMPFVETQVRPLWKGIAALGLFKFASIAESSGKK